MRIRFEIGELEETKLMMSEYKGIL